MEIFMHIKWEGSTWRQRQLLYLALQGSFTRWGIARVIKSFSVPSGIAVLVIASSQRNKKECTLYGAFLVSEPQNEFRISHYTYTEMGVGQSLDLLMQGNDLFVRITEDGEDKVEAFDFVGV